jgi:hypothetical protein
MSLLDEFSGGLPDVPGRIVDAAAPRVDRIEGGRIIEARGTDAAGGRIFGVTIIQPGTSKNGVTYPAQVLASAAPLYNGAKAFDHHRTAEELQSSSIAGLVGTYRNVTADQSGVHADLHLLPGATHVAEAFDASLAAQAEGLPPLVGISHDVLMSEARTADGGREAKQIQRVLSADVVADPAAGGHATRVLASEDAPIPTTEQEEVTMTLAELLKQATPEELAEVRALLAATTESQPDPAPAATISDPEPERELVGAAAEADRFARGSAVADMIVERVCASAGIADAARVVGDMLPERFTEAQARNAANAAKRVAEGIEQRQLAPKVPHVAVGPEDMDRKRARVDAMFGVKVVGRNSEGVEDVRLIGPMEGGGYNSIRQAYLDVSGQLGKIDPWGDDLIHGILRESFDASRKEGARRTESLTTASWGEILGDSITRRMVAEYSRPNLQTWTNIVSSIVPITDFRTQRVTRFGGYGVLPSVTQGAPYQPLTSPTDEEATYTVGKRGGTEDLTLEMIANDNLSAIQRIPVRLGNAAAQTLYRGVFDLLATNATCTYDSTALFAAGHGSNTAAAALSQTALAAARTTMMKQAAYGDSSDVLGILPRFLVVPADLLELAFQLTNSAVAVPATAAGPSDTPNINTSGEYRMQTIPVPYLTDTNDWFVVADPATVPTIEVGFYQNRRVPELFVQDDPLVGAAFSSDKVTWKIRHIWGVTILDHRGFYRGTQ